MKISFTLSSFLCLFSLSTACAVELYSADFSVDGQGSTHNTAGDEIESSPVVGVNWQLSWETPPRSDGSTNFLITQGGVLASSDWGGLAVFESGVIDVSAVDEVSLTTMGVTMGSDVFGSDSEFFSWFYVLDGGARVVAATFSDDGSLDYGEILDVAGVSTLQVGFEFRMNGGDDGFEVGAVVVDDSVPESLVLNLPDQELAESDSAGGVTSLTAQVTRPGDVTNDLVITLVNGDASVISIPETVTIPAGMSAVEFTVESLDDDLFDGVQIAVIMASAEGLRPADGAVIVNDDEVFTFPELRLNEIRVDQTDDDIDEFVELFSATQGASLDRVTLLVLGDGSSESGSGVIEAVVDFSGNMITGNHFLIGESTMTTATPDLVAALNFENDDNVTFLLVGGFTGAHMDDLDTDDDGVLDVSPWSVILDGVALIKEANPPSNTEFEYATSLGFAAVGPFVREVDETSPFHIFRGGKEAWEIGLEESTEDTPGAVNPVIERAVEAAAQIVAFSIDGPNAVLRALGLGTKLWKIETSVDLSESDAWADLSVVVTEANHADGSRSFSFPKLAADEKRFYRLVEQ